MDDDRGAQAEVRVQQWREAGKLPFAEFGNKERQQLLDTLDYPPKGSPAYEPPKAFFDQQSAKGPSAFSPDDFGNLPSFAAKLQERNQIADYLWGRLSIKTQKLLMKYSTEVDTELREALVRDLNAIIQGAARRHDGGRDIR